MKHQYWRSSEIKDPQRFGFVWFIFMSLANAVVDNKICALLSIFSFFSVIFLKLLQVLVLLQIVVLIYRFTSCGRNLAGFRIIV